MRTEGDVLRDWKDADMRAAGWIMIPGGCIGKMKNIVAKGFDDLAKYINVDIPHRDMRTVVDEDLLTLIQDLERQIIEFISLAIHRWDMSQLKARNDATVDVVTPDDATNEALSIIDDLMARFYNHVTKHSLIDSADKLQDRLYLHLARVEEHLKDYLPMLIACWK
jgi:hypothetical protein